MPSSNKKYWKYKLQRNVLKDKENIEKLEKQGWFVIVVWECELSNKTVEYTLNNMYSAIVLQKG